MRILGIDPGVNGACALITETGRYIDSFLMPTVAANKSSDRQMVNPYELSNKLRVWLTQHGDCIAITENVNTMPDWGVASAGAFMKSYGLMLGTVAALGISMEIVAPPRWKKAFNLPRDKEQARELAVRIFPGAPLSRKKDHNVAEALLIAKYYRDFILKRQVE